MGLLPVRTVWWWGMPWAWVLGPVPRMELQQRGQGSHVAPECSARRPQGAGAWGWQRAAGVDCSPVASAQGGNGAKRGFASAEDDEDLDKTLSIKRFGDLISKSAARDLEKQQRSYNERDFECT